MRGQVNLFFYGMGLFVLSVGLVPTRSSAGGSLVPACETGRFQIRACQLSSESDIFVHDLEFGGRSDVGFSQAQVYEQDLPQAVEGIEALPTTFRDTNLWKVPRSGYYPQVELQFQLNNILSAQQIKKDVKIFGIEGQLVANQKLDTCSMKLGEAAPQDCLLSKAAFSQPTISYSPSIHSSSLYPNSFTFWSGSSVFIPPMIRSQSGSSVACFSNPMAVFPSISVPNTSSRPCAASFSIPAENRFTILRDCSFTGRVFDFAPSAWTWSAPFTSCPTTKLLADCTSNSEPGCEWLPSPSETPSIRHGFPYLMNATYGRIPVGVDYVYRKASSSMPFGLMVRVYPDTSEYRALWNRRLKDLPLLQYSDPQILGQTLLLKKGMNTTVSPTNLNQVVPDACDVVRYGDVQSVSIAGTGSPVILSMFGEGSGGFVPSSVSTTQISVTSSCELSVQLSTGAVEGALVPVSVIPKKRIDGVLLDGAPIDFILQVAKTEETSGSASALTVANPYVYPRQNGGRSSACQISYNSGDNFASIDSTPCLFDLTKKSTESASVSSITRFLDGRGTSFFLRRQGDLCPQSDDRTVQNNDLLLPGSSCTIPAGTENGYLSGSQYGGRANLCKADGSKNWDCWFGSGVYSKEAAKECESDSDDYTMVDWNHTALRDTDGSGVLRPWIRPLARAPLVSCKITHQTTDPSKASPKGAMFFSSTPLGGRYKSCRDNSSDRGCWMFKAGSTITYYPNPDTRTGGQPIKRLSKAEIVKPEFIKKGIKIFGVVGTSAGVASDFGSGVYRKIDATASTRLTYSTETATPSPYAKHLPVPPVGGLEKSASSRKPVRTNNFQSVSCNDALDCVSKLGGLLGGTNLIATSDGVLWDGEALGVAGEGKWQLEQRKLVSGRWHEVWTDLSTGLLWSTLVGPGDGVQRKFNWCEASGAHSSYNAAVDPRTKSQEDSICGARDNLNQDNFNHADPSNQNLSVKSACYSGSGFTTSFRGSGVGSIGLGAYYWRLPTIFDYMLAAHNGLSMVFPDMTGLEWTSTVYSKDSNQSYVFDAQDRTRKKRHQYVNTIDARCVGRKVRQ
ncbi:hypothetical protein EBZ37_01815 [bacterium]|nr:hypothetical protein [bacterium]